MNKQVRVTAVHAIADGHVDEVKQMAAKIIEKVSDGEPGYLRYEWFLSDDQSTIYIVGLLEDSAAVLAHMANVAELIGPLNEIAPGTRIEIYGDVSDEVRRFVAPFGATIVGYFDGFAR